MSAAYIKTINTRGSEAQQSWLKYTSNITRGKRALASTSQIRNSGICNVSVRNLQLLQISKT